LTEWQIPMTGGSMPRPDGRAPDALRPITLERHANPYAEGSCLARFGATLVLCTASIIESVPAWRRGRGVGWLTAEYAMLPRATAERTPRERTGLGGRTQEIQRLIGRSLRGALRSFDFGERTIQIDCDVLQADGGTRTAAITGAAVALHDACAWLTEQHGVANPLGRLVAAVSVGIVGGAPVLDLCYAEDRDADVDANVVVLEPDRYVEVQATGEAGNFDRRQLDGLLALADAGIAQVFAEQHRVLA
jgi:ribonuclease PH